MTDPTFIFGFLAGFGLATTVISVGYLIAGFYSTMVARKVAEYDGPTGEEAPEEASPVRSGSEDPKSVALAGALPEHDLRRVRDLINRARTVHRAAPRNLLPHTWTNPDVHPHDAGRGVE